VTGIEAIGRGEVALLLEGDGHHNAAELPARGARPPLR
jgi:hypothetical protein